MKMPTFANQAQLIYNNTTTASNVVTGELVDVLSATKTVVNGSYTSNDLITYAVSIINSGSAPFSALNISDDLGAYTFGTGSLVPLEYEAGSVRYYVNGVLQTAPAVTAGPPLTISGINVPASGNALILYSARTNQFAPLDVEGEISNTATITGGGLSAPVIAQATLAAASQLQLSISKSVCPSTISENEPLTYTLLVQNLGNIPAEATDNIIITDTFDPILTITNVRFNGTNWSSPANYSYDTATGLFATASNQITVPAATYTQDPVSGAWSITPGTSELTITGIV